MYYRPMEFWLPITDQICSNIMEGWYWISSEGRVYSAISNRIMSLSDDKDGYKLVGLYNKDRNQITYRVHRLVLKAFNFNPNHKSLVVNHISAIKYENHEFNLEWVTDKENKHHAMSLGLMADVNRSKNPMASISEEQADYIGYLLSTEKYSIQEISYMTNVNDGIIGSIKNGSGWVYYYNKYDLGNKHIPRYHEVFTFNQLHYICQYFVDNNIHDLNQLTREIKLDILRKLNLEPTELRIKTIYKLFSRNRFNKISSNYNF